jgi:ribosomal protein S4
VYAGFGRRFRKENKFRRLKIKPYLRRKNPRSEKRNQLYKRSSLLLANFRQRRRVQAKKAARIKEIVSKIIGPFYGNLRKKQMRFLRTQSKRLKSKILTSNETLLSHLENRLDVVIYRLNLAPTIL